MPGSRCAKTPTADPHENRPSSRDLGHEIYSGCVGTVAHHGLDTVARSVRGSARERRRDVAEDDRALATHRMIEVESHWKIVKAAPSTVGLTVVLLPSAAAHSVGTRPYGPTQSYDAGIAIPARDQHPRRLVGRLADVDTHRSRRCGRGGGRE